jgi:hypothetical protein
VGGLGSWILEDSQERRGCRWQKFMVGGWGPERWASDHRTQEQPWWISENSTLSLFLELRSHIPPSWNLNDAGQPASKTQGDPEDEEQEDRESSRIRMRTSSKRPSLGSVLSSAGR